MAFHPDPGRDGCRSALGPVYGSREEAEWAVMLSPMLQIIGFADRFSARPGGGTGDWRLSGAPSADPRRVA
jgi:hypothetical protein